MPEVVLKIKDIVEIIRARQSEEKDANICITGFRGQGKSTLAWRIARQLKKYIIKHDEKIYETKKFKPIRDMMYSKEEVLNFILHRKFSVAMVDELINVAYNREFASGDQQAIAKALNQFRAPHFNVYLMCSPMFYDLDPDFRNLFWLRIDVVKRGKSIINMAQESIYGNDPWNTDYNRKVENKWKQKDGSVKPRYKQLTTFKGYLQFNKLTPKAKALYESIRDDKRMKANKYMLGKPTDKQATIYDNLIKLGNEGKLTKELFETICGVNNIKPSMAQSWINKKLKEAKSNKTFKNLLIKEVKKEENVDELGYALK